MKMLVMVAVMLCTQVDVRAQMYDDGYGGGGYGGGGGFAPQFNPQISLPAPRGGCGPGCGGGGGGAAQTVGQANLPSGAVFAYLMANAVNQHYLQDQWAREQGYQHDAWAQHLQYLQLQQVWQQQRDRDARGGCASGYGGGCGAPVAYAGYGGPPIRVDVNLVRRRRARCIGIGSTGGY